MVLVFDEEVIRVICAYAPQIKRSECEKNQFYNDVASEWDLQNLDKVVLDLGDFSEHVGKRIDGSEGVHVGYRIGKKNVEGRRIFEFYDKKELCVANIRFEKMERKKTTYIMSGKETEIHFVLVGKNNRKHLKDVKAISWELHHRLVVTDIEKKKFKKVV